MIDLLPNACKPLTCLPVSYLGAAAQASLRRTAFFNVCGLTSRGVFLAADRPAGGQPGVLFLSFEPWRGPLTLNLAPGAAAALAGLAVGERLAAQPDGLWWAARRLLIRSVEAQAWWANTCPQADLHPRPLSLEGSGERITPTPFQGEEVEGESQRRVAWMARRLSAEVNAAPFAAWLTEMSSSYPLPGESSAPLPPLSGKGPGDGGRPTEEPAEIGQVLALPFAALVQACQDWKATPLLSLLGRGPGLTPAGDDLLLGLLLALSRYAAAEPARGPQGCRRGQAEAFYQEIVAAAPQGTTALSAALIACATQSQADERLVAGLDWLAGGAEPGAEPAVRLLLGWGATSGIAAFIGMAIGLKVVRIA